MPVKLYNRQMQAERQLHMGCGETLDPQMRAWLRERDGKQRGQGRDAAVRPGRQAERAR